VLRYLTMKTIGHRIREEREKSGLTQPQLAEACGWESQGRISNYENGLREPKLEDLKHIRNYAQNFLTIASFYHLKHHIMC